MKKITFTTIALLFLSLFVWSAISGEQEQKQFAGYLNINTAAYEQLLELPDMSDSLARNIILYREANGPFSSVDDLIKVKGFWYTYIDQLRPYIRLEGENTLRLVE
ncbi:MAG: helix-hairpin-helix domain-containing protein [Deltaproteobacteria bacterium]|nr:helix-hairpin-helix domain-containing protein [Deltaproteobacteria bacterium]